MTPAEKKRLTELINLARHEHNDEITVLLETMAIADILQEMDEVLAEMKKAAAAIVENAKRDNNHAGR